MSFKDFLKTRLTEGTYDSSSTPQQTAPSEITNPTTVTEHPNVTSTTSNPPVTQEDTLVAGKEVTPETGQTAWSDSYDNIIKAINMIREEKMNVKEKCGKEMYESLLRYVEGIDNIGASMLGEAVTLSNLDVPELKLLTDIAKHWLDFETLNTKKNSDDFKEVAVYNVKDALIAAFVAGQKYGRNSR